LDKIQIIEKLFLHIVCYSYLLIPLSFFLSKNRFKERIPFFIAIYGVLFFCLLMAYGDVPKNYKKAYQFIYTYTEYLFLTFLIWPTITAKKFKRVVVILSISFLAFQIFYFFNTNNTRLDSVPIGIETILMLVYIVYFFLQFSKNTGATYIYDHYLFWLSVGILVYLGGSFFFFILINHLSNEQINTFGNITYLTEVFKNILFAIGIFVYSKNKTQRKDTNQRNVPNLDMI